MIVGGMNADYLNSLMIDYWWDLNLRSI
jgi:hypothetical protein